MTGLLFAHDDPRGDYRLREPCAQCGGETGRVERRGSQDCIYCDCGTYQYNAPRTETGSRSRTPASLHAQVHARKRTRVLGRAGYRCQLCNAVNRPLEVGHVLSVKDGLARGVPEHLLNSDENLMAMCDRCNAGIGETSLPLWLADELLRRSIG